VELPTTPKTSNDAQQTQEQKEGKLTDLVGRRATTAAREVNKIGTSLLTMEEEKMVTMKEATFQLKRIADCFEEFIQLKKPKL